MNTPTREKLGEQARAVLLAEALGDVQKLNDKLLEFETKLDALATRLDAGARRDWVALLDSKMREFQHFQIPELAAVKLQVHSETFLRGLMSEVKHLVAKEVKIQSGHRQVLLLAGAFFSGVVAAKLLHFFA
jgi:hypothetical protein